MARFIQQDVWQVFDLTMPGWQISDVAVQEKITEIERISEETDIKAVVVLQLHNNSVYMVGGPGGVKHLPACDPSGLYHVDGPLVLADMVGVKDLTLKLISLVKALDSSKKLILSPLGRFWRAPCHKQARHVANYRDPGHLTNLSSSLHTLPDKIRDTLFTKRVPNFRVLCLTE
jgi:hypothetical protein